LLIRASSREQFAIGLPEYGEDAAGSAAEIISMGVST
jgi:hypothetical protein